MGRASTRLMRRHVTLALRAGSGRAARRHAVPRGVGATHQRLPVRGRATRGRPPRAPSDDEATALAESDSYARRTARQRAPVLAQCDSARPTFQTAPRRPNRQFRRRHRAARAASLQQCVARMWTAACGPRPRRAAGVRWVCESPPVNIRGPVERSAAVTLFALAALHAVWATGSSWPAKDRDALAELMAGRAGGSAPPAAACLTVATLLTSASVLVSGRPRRTAGATARRSRRGGCRPWCTWRLR